MELFAWLKLHKLQASELILEAGPGFVTIKPMAGGYATVKDLVQDPNKGTLISATAVARLRKGADLRYVLLQRDLEAPVSPGCWQIPAGRCSPGENPVETAVRELIEEVGLEAEGLSWAHGTVDTGATSVRYQINEGTVEFTGQWAFHHNTYEFYVFVDLEVASFDSVRLWDLEPYGRPVRLFTTEELLSLHQQNKLADGTQAVVSAMLSRSQLA